MACRDEFIESARIFMFETYCRIHQCIDIKYVDVECKCAPSTSLPRMTLTHSLTHSTRLRHCRRMLAEKLNMNLDEAERWIVNLIRNARLDAKIDSAQGHVIMGTQYPSLYQQVIDKTKPLTYRTFLMSNTIARQEV